MLLDPGCVARRSGLALGGLWMGPFACWISRPCETKFERRGIAKSSFFSCEQWARNA
jgi:hypothetical protein